MSMLRLFTKNLQVTAVEVRLEEIEKQIRANSVKRQKIKAESVKLRQEADEIRRTARSKQI